MKISSMLLSGLCATLIPAMSFAGQISGTIGVRLVITANGATSSSLSSDPGAYSNYQSMAILTNAANGETVDILVNGQKVASAISQNGTIHVEISWKQEDAVNLSFRSEGKELQVLQTAYVNGQTMAPKMTPQTYTQKVTTENADGTTSTKNVEVQTVVIEY
ncbi:hypothetical protein [Bdellovibrio reynosensis]|uniref:Uncharacterized protein n=1 Tax=Bdellovibrio reynosensis TaxID=2835041 RepID=A0ABY4CAV3_9BACT|nr:hypothetical protein [Bdellovibrio reynosensis]UOF01022.1 hypothetical protein MNR06_15080 [Bdellovibrio reynosensis]